MGGCIKTMTSLKLNFLDQTTIPDDKGVKSEDLPVLKFQPYLWSWRLVVLSCASLALALLRR